MSSGKIITFLVLLGFVCTTLSQYTKTVLTDGDFSDVTTDSELASLFANPTTNTIQVYQGTTLQQTISLTTSPTALAYDMEAHILWVLTDNPSGQRDQITGYRRTIPSGTYQVLATTDSIPLTTTYSSSRIAVDQSTGDIYVSVSNSPFGFYKIPSFNRNDGLLSNSVTFVPYSNMIVGLTVAGSNIVAAVPDMNSLVLFDTTTYSQQPTITIPSVNDVVADDPLHPTFYAAVSNSGGVGIINIVQLSPQSVTSYSTTPSMASATAISYLKPIDQYFVTDPADTQALLVQVPSTCSLMNGDAEAPYTGGAPPDWTLIPSTGNPIRVDATTTGPSPVNAPIYPYEGNQFFCMEFI
jgi:hypothetical protein